MIEVTDADARQLGRLLCELEKLGPQYGADAAALKRVLDARAASAETASRQADSLGALCDEMADLVGQPRNAATSAPEITATKARELIDWPTSARWEYDGSPHSSYRCCGCARSFTAHEFNEQEAVRRENHEEDCTVVRLNAALELLASLLDAREAQTPSRWTLRAIQHAVRVVAEFGAPLSAELLDACEARGDAEARKP